MVRRRNTDTVITVSLPSQVVKIVWVLPMLLIILVLQLVVCQSFPMFCHVLKHGTEA